MSTIYNIVVDLVDFVGGFFEYVFVPPFLREYDIQYQNETKIRETRQIIERIERAQDHLEKIIAQGQTSIEADRMRLIALDASIEEAEGHVLNGSAKGVSARELDLRRSAMESLQHEYKSLATVCDHRAQWVSAHQLTLTQLKSNHTLLSSADIDSSLLLSKGALSTLLSTIRTKSNAQSLQQTIQVLGSMYLAGDAVTEENVLARTGRYDS